MKGSLAARALRGAAVLALGALFAVVAALGGVSVATGVDNTAATLPVSVAAPPSAGDLSVAEIGSDAAAAGFKGTSLAMAIAVALAESSGNPVATNLDDNGTIDRGVWQINSVHTSVSDACAYDPPCAAEAAFAISDGGTDWEPWVTYQHGAEIAYLPEAIAYVEQRGTAA